MGLLRNLEIMLGSTVTRTVCSQLYDWIEAVSLVLDGENPVMNQVGWFIDPVNGNDSASGASASAPIKTVGAMNARMGQFPTWTLPEYHIYIVNDLPANDPLVLVGVLEPGTNIYVHGNATPGKGKAILATLAVDAVTTVVHSTNTPLQVTSNGLATGWVADGLINTRCRMTSGANIGGVMWPIAEPGALKQARMNEAQVVEPFLNPFAFSTSTFNPALNDTFVVESLSNLPGVFLDLVGMTPFNGITNAVMFDSVIINQFSITGFGCGVNMFGVDFASAVVNGIPKLVQIGGTRFRSGSNLTANSMQLANSYHDDNTAAFGTLRVLGNGSTMTRHMTQQRQGIRISAPRMNNSASNMMQIISLGIFNNSAGNGCEISGTANLSGTAEIWGVAGAGGNAFALQAESSLTYAAATPGAASYFFVSVAASPATAWMSYKSLGAFQTSAPAFNPATQVFTTFRALTAALIQATIAGGGVNGNWFDPSSGCRMMQV